MALFIFLYANAYNTRLFRPLSEWFKTKQKKINAVYKRLVKWLPEAIRLIDVSFLAEAYRIAYKDLVTERVQQFTS